VDDEWPPRENRVQAALWEAERALERFEYLPAARTLARVFGLAGEREELVRGLHHLAAAGYKSRAGDAGRACRQLDHARRRLAPFPEAERLVDLVQRDVDSGGWTAGGTGRR
jgi:hypothetical protein